MFSLSPKPSCSPPFVWLFQHTICSKAFHGSLLLDRWNPNFLGLMIRQPLPYLLLIFPYGACFILLILPCLPFQILPFLKPRSNASSRKPSMITHWSVLSLLQKQMATTLLFGHLPHIAGIYLKILSPCWIIIAEIAWTILFFLYFR